MFSSHSLYDESDRDHLQECHYHVIQGSALSLLITGTTYDPCLSANLLKHYREKHENADIPDDLIDTANNGTVNTSLLSAGGSTDQMSAVVALCQSIDSQDNMSSVSEMSESRQSAGLEFEVLLHSCIFIHSIVVSFSSFWLPFWCVVTCELITSVRAPILSRRLNCGRAVMCIDCIT